MRKKFKPRGSITNCFADLTILQSNLSKEFRPISSNKVLKALLNLSENKESK